jgi:hypothetical protein
MIYIKDPSNRYHPLIIIQFRQYECDERDSKFGKAEIDEGLRPALIQAILITGRTRFT